MSQPENRGKAVAYIRVSSDEQVEGLSLESQEVKIREWCEQRGYEIVASFRDEGESAFTDDIKKRPQFAKLLERLPHLRPAIDVVYSLDRCARSLVVASESFRRLAAVGVAFASVTEQQFDFRNPASGLHLNMLASFAQYSSQMTSQHVKRVNDLKFDRGVHRGSVPFGYIADPNSTRGEPRPPIPHPDEFPVLQELFQWAKSGSETCRTLAEWLNYNGFETRNRKKSVAEEESGDSARPRKFVADGVNAILRNPFYAGLVVKQSRTKKGVTSTAVETRPGLHQAAVSPEDFDRVQSVLRSHYRAPRSASKRFRPYLGKDLVRCNSCGEKAWCRHIKSSDYYQESSANRGIACDSAGRYWPAPVIDDQIVRLVKPIALPMEWRERALTLANAENNLVDMRAERQSLEGKRRRIVELYKDGVIDKVEFDRELGILDNKLSIAVPVI